MSIPQERSILSKLSHVGVLSRAVSSCYLDLFYWLWLWEYSPTILRFGPRLQWTERGYKYVVNFKYWRWDIALEFELFMWQITYLLLHKILLIKRVELDNILFNSIVIYFLRTVWITKYFKRGVTLPNKYNVEMIIIYKNTN